MINGRPLTTWNARVFNDVLVKESFLLCKIRTKIFLWTKLCMVSHFHIVQKMKTGANQTSLNDSGQGNCIPARAEAMRLWDEL